MRREYLSLCFGHTRDACSHLAALAQVTDYQRNRIEAHPSVEFIIVINPASGPGSSPLPDANFTREISRLNEFSNVRTIGYVAVDYGRKPLETAFQEIAQYGTWTSQNQKLSMQGIFLDESPQLADPHNTTFLQKVRQNVKTARYLSGGLLGTLLRSSLFLLPLSFAGIFLAILRWKQSINIPSLNHPANHLDIKPVPHFPVCVELARANSFAVMNPGMIPDAQILATADKTVVFEEKYQTYVNLQAAKQLAALPDRNALVTLMHSIPTDMPVPQIKAIVGELRELSGSMFITDLNDLYYQQFSPRFNEFVDAMK